LVQATWNKVLENPPQGVASPRNWLARLLRNTFYSDYRSSRRRLVREANIARPDADHTAQQVVERGEINRLLADAVMKLDEPFRTAILLRYHEDWSAQKIAKHLEIPASTARSRIKRGLEKLRGEISQKWGKEWKQCHLALASFSMASRSTPVLNMSAVVFAGAIIVAAIATVLIEPWKANEVIGDVEASAATEVESNPDVLVAGPEPNSGFGIRMLDDKGAQDPSSDLIILKGRILAKDSGSPLAGATVKLATQLWITNKPSDIVEWEDPEDVITTEDGLFELSFPKPPKGSSHSFSISASGLIERRAEWNRQSSAICSHDFGDVVLEKGVVLFGNVVCDEGDFPARAVVAIGGIRGYGLFADAPVTNRVYTITDGHGNFRMTAGVPAGVHEIKVNAPGYKWIGPSTVEIESGAEEQGMELHISEFPYISGRLEMVDGTAPGPVFLNGVGPIKRSGKYSATWSKSDGTFRLPATERNSGDSGFAIEVVDQRRVGVQGKTTEAIYNWGDRNVVIQVDSTLFLDIRVVDDASGEPIENYAVICKSEKDRNTMSGNDMRLNGFHENGILRVENLSQGTNLLQILPVEDIYTKQEWLEVQPTHKDLGQLLIRLECKVSIPVVLRTQQGMPIEGSTISLHDGKPFQRMISSAVTDENGECDLLWPPSVGAGMVRATGVHANTEKYIESPIGQPGSIELVVAEAALVTGTVALDPKAVGKMRLIFESIEGVVVMSNLEESTLKPEDDGSFEVTLDPGRYQVVAMYPNAHHSNNGGFQGRWLRMEPPLAEIVVGSGPAPELTLDATHFAPAKISATVNLDGAPAANFPLRLVLRSKAEPHNPFGYMEKFFTDEFGHFEVDDLMPGVIDVLLENPGNKPGWKGTARSSEGVLVMSGESKVAIFETFYRELKIRPLHPETGKPMPNTTWSVMPMPNTNWMAIRIVNKTTDEDGWLLIAPAPLGEVILNSQPEGRTYFKTEAAQIDMEQLTTELELSTTEEINGFR
ncbi:MAG: sigma-70 family RNA polymerase sigma factor, partial [Planctomycetes bacterium]|nr:sigma-70 family RNA polymerase sigma factor [Planctomycetota bacterium]